MENLDKSTKLPSQIMEDLLTNFKIPEEKQVNFTCNNQDCHSLTKLLHW